MPTNPEWLIRLPEIVAGLRILTVATIDRSMMQWIFRLKRRHAIELMHQFGSYRSGRGFLLDRSNLISVLEDLQGHPRFRWEQYRRGAFVHNLDDFQRSMPPAGASTLGRNLDFALPEGVRVIGRQLVVDFNSVEDLYAKLLAVLQSLSG